LLNLDKYFIQDLNNTLISHQTISSPIKTTWLSTGSIYPNSIEFDDFTTPFSFLKTGDYYQYPLLSDFSENDDSYLNYKRLLELNSSFSTLLLGTGSKGFLPYSYLSVLNNFRSDYEDFT